LTGVLEDPPPVQPVDLPPLPRFILQQQGELFADSLEQLASWVHGLLIPIYVREISTQAPWCPEWWRHPEAVGQLHALFLAWQQLTAPDAELTGPAVWHRDFLVPSLAVLRDPSGTFAGCKPGTHRDKQPPPIIAFDD
jgi:uncharacterized protein DUF4913